MHSLQKRTTPISYSKLLLGKRSDCYDIMCNKEKRKLPVTIYNINGKYDDFKYHRVTTT